MIGASMAIAMSDIPWDGPIAGVSVGLVDGEIVLNPTKEQREHSDLSLTLAASEEKIVMIEAGANEVDEETMMKAIRAGHEEIKKMLAFINGIVAEIGKPKKSFTPVELDHALLADVYAKHLDEVKAAMDTDDKNVRDARSAAHHGCHRRRASPTWTAADLGSHQLQDAEEGRAHAGCWTTASVWTAAASTRSARWPPRSACCPASTAPACSPAARPRC